MNVKYEALSQMTNEDLLRELLHRIDNFSKYKLLTTDDCVQVTLF